MGEEHTIATEERPSEAEESARHAVEDGTASRLVEELIERVGGRAGTQAVFSEPIERDGLTVVPVARVRWGVPGNRQRWGKVPTDPAAARCRLRAGIRHHRGHRASGPGTLRTSLTAWR
jgi:hypothetical protein